MRQIKPVPFVSKKKRKVEYERQTNNANDIRRIWG